MSDYAERRHRRHLWWISAKGWLIVIGMYCVAGLFAAAILMWWVRLVTPESWWRS